MPYDHNKGAKPIDNCVKVEYCKGDNLLYSRKSRNRTVKSDNRKKKY